MGKPFNPRPIDDWVIANLTRFDPFYKGPKSKLGAMAAPPAPAVELDAAKTASDLGYDPLPKK